MTFLYTLHGAALKPHVCLFLLCTPCKPKIVSATNVMLPVCSHSTCDLRIVTTYFPSHSHDRSHNFTLERVFCLSLVSSARSNPPSKRSYTNTGPGVRHPFTHSWNEAPMLAVLRSVDFHTLFKHLLWLLNPSSPRSFAPQPTVYAFVKFASF